ncbi:hypothetical protein [Pedobacter antarcticus]|uniref:hypothetical protein n=1 Tax=Pedobacter antarcticus TaxID=34086 RepID=UPI00088F8CDA|nr:hypothetical protein [Pedobacter antarcticus]SDM40160.1 hypothetical protein SAMN04488084_106157 [Pedobacter antarcticus]
MEDIVFKAKYRGKRRTFTISLVPGGCGSWRLMIDDGYYGSFIQYCGKWSFRPQQSYYFTDDQEEILLNQLRKRYPADQF